MKENNKTHLTEMNEKRAIEKGHEWAFPGENNSHYHFGLTKKEYIATQILNGFISHYGDDSLVNDVVKKTVQLTEQLLIELNKNER